MGKEIYFVQLFFSIFIISSKTNGKQSGVFSKKDQYSYRKANNNVPSTTILVFPTTSTTTSPKMAHSSNTFCNKRLFPNMYMLILLLSPKPVFRNKFPFGKANEFAFYIMPKNAFAEKVDNDDTNFELASCGYFYKLISFLLRIIQFKN